MLLIDDLNHARAMLCEAVAGAGRIVPFTGAGISTESGIPDFRSPGSIWTRRKPTPFQEFVASREARVRAWTGLFELADLYAGVGPSEGHRAVARLVASGKAETVVTQNIDGLHQRAGVPGEKVVEIHGNGTFAKCLDCGTRHDFTDVRPAFEATGVPPACRACGGIVKSATISFGQAMPEAEMRRASAAARDCDLFLVLGSSLVVYPAAGLPLLAKEAGADLVIVNREPTELDRYADLVLRCEIGPLTAGLLADASA